MDINEGTSSRMRNFFFVLNCIILCIGFIGGPLIARLYFLHGGQRIWFSSWLQSVGWPLTLTVLIIAYLRRRMSTGGSRAKLIYVTRQEFAVSATIGILIGLSAYLFSWGPAKLPVSTSSVIGATQLGFTAVFSFLLVKQKLTAYSTNAVVLLIAGSVTLAFGAESDRPPGESTKQYVLGFVMTLLAAAIIGLELPLIELIYMKSKQKVTYIMVLEIQMTMGFFATCFATIGMIVNKDFQAISREAKQFGLGEIKYYLVIVWSAIIWQLSTLGIAGVILYSSSLFSGVLLTFLLPITELLGVVLYHEKCQATKGLAIFLSLWGFVSYFYGQLKQSKNKEKMIAENQITHPQLPDTIPTSRV